MSETIPRYGVHSQGVPADDVERAAESLRLLGYAYLPAGLDAAALTTLRDKFEDARARQAQEFGAENLASLGEADTIRCLLRYDPAFLDLALHPLLQGLCRMLLGAGFVLNQQNGVINPAGAERYSQDAYHRDLPYQHFTSSRPLALNALFCLDDFTAENGATLVIPASHKHEDFPSDDLVRASERLLTAPAGTFLVLDCMTYHRGSRNTTRRDRRAVNHVFAFGLLRQQIDLAGVLGPEYTRDPDVRRLLGYEYQTPRSLGEYFGQRRRRRGS